MWKTKVIHRKYANGVSAAITGAQTIRRFPGWIAAQLLLAGGLIPGLTGNAHAAQTVVNVRSCPGCTYAAMQQTASNYRGIVFIYDLNVPIIHKFNVSLDSTCAAAPVPSSNVTDDGDATAATGSAPNCGSTKSVDEWPVDDSVKTIFNHLVRAYQENPGLVSTAQDRIPLRNLPPDPITRQPFNLPQAAWEYPQGTYRRLEEMLVQVIGNPAELSQVDPALADYVYGVQTPSINGITIGLGIGSNGGNVNGSVQLQWDKSQSIGLQICNSVGDCANFTLIHTNDRGWQLDFRDVEDLYGNVYPEPNATYPSNPKWYWHDSIGANHFIQQLGGGGWGDLHASCNSVWLICSWKGNELIGCYTQCL
jgi:RNA polymerase subunit RPABC4/transcription elongation factor Spt4